MKILTITCLLLCHAIFLLAQDYKKGAYYDLDYNRFEGLINENYLSLVGNNSILFHFKDSIDSEKRKVKEFDVSSYVIESDSFAIITDVGINATTYVERDFAKVLEIGKLSLYSYHSMIHSAPTGVNGTQVTFTFGYGMETLVITKNGISYRMQKHKDFKNILPGLVEDCTPIASHLKEKYTEDGLRQLVKSYNEHFPDYQKGLSVPISKLIVYRSSNKKNTAEIQAVLNDSIHVNLTPGSYYEFELPIDSNPFHLQIDNGQSINIHSEDAEDWKYVKCFFNKKTGQYLIKLTSMEEGDFDVYVIQKGQKN